VFDNGPTTISFSSLNAGQCNGRTYIGLLVYVGIQQVWIALNNLTLYSV